MTYFEQRLIRKQARLTQKLEHIKTKLANRALIVQRRIRERRNPYVSTVRGIVTGIAFAGFWWLGCNRINGLIDDLFGESSATLQHPAASTAHAQTFWTFGRRRRSGESRIRPAG